MYLKAAGALFLAVAGVAQAQVGLNVNVEERVRAYFAETPVMIEIARCESKFRQYSDSGGALRGGAGGSMVGVYQVHSDIHADFARARGMDIETLEGNLGYAKYLYDTEGTRPWISSIGCWGNEINTNVSAAPSDTITLNLSLGMEHPQIRLLQKTLNAKGFVVAADGPGSSGQETEKYGLLTRAAVQKFQCATIRVCDGDEHSTGYGFVGARTRAALASSAIAMPEAESGYSVAQIAEIARLQDQIAELTKVLMELLSARGRVN